MRPGWPASTESSLNSTAVRSSGVPSSVARQAASSSTSPLPGGGAGDLGSRRVRRAALALSLAAAAACGSGGRDLPGERTGRARQALTTNERVLGCENASDWSASTAGTSLSTSSDHVEGAASLAVASPASGGTYLTSIPLSSLGSDVGDSVTVDVRYPNPPPNPYYFGEVGVVLVSPSLGLWWENLGTMSFAGTI